MSNEGEKWDNIAKSWDTKIVSKNEPHYHYYHTIDILITKILQKNGINNALELGCGTAGAAINVLTLLKDKKIDITGIDVSPQMIKLGREKIKKFNLEDRITLEVGDVTDLPYKDKEFDAVFSRGAVLSYTKKTREVLKETNRVLRGGGIIGLDAMPQPKEDFYLGRVKNSKPGTINPFLTTSSDLTYSEYFSKGNLQVSRGYRVPPKTNLYTELFELFCKLQPNAYGIFQPPSYLDEAQLISNGSATLFNENELRNVVTKTGFNVKFIFGAGLGNVFRRNTELWEFVNTHRDKISQIELFLQQHGILNTKHGGMLFIHGEKI